MRFEEAAPAAIVVGCATEKVLGSRLGPTDVSSSSHRGPSWSVVGIKILKSCGGSDAFAITCGRERAALSHKPRFRVATGGMRRLALPQGAVGGRPSQGRVLHRFKSILLEINQRCEYKSTEREISRLISIWVDLSQGQARPCDYLSDRFKSTRSTYPISYNSDLRSRKSIGLIV